ncbi:MAG: FAD-dependent oxidoreductase [Gammaproteobacteria bacterium]|uniref:NAD(P)/FAD-dependent oxidoreductase n=1 Tax=Rhodoferax sp. TaxID=50421 RepID=UPI0017C1EC33|nr:FAD-dependent oxidoreductase [Rhodoferax sp.]MBU3900788.1 FAD-dependent oxidoreductase [Gammaproteobacteria bacterium]MBA3056667.1 NAD/FAD-binding protein [Rhodoferax sp.]MBU3997169.1 FAD-dependent oxidoreductase [Gammaproteobacteria bacterium]MBU4079539.1 FAD-dependent oxidoreductase [Gammaproteobacteria bacterium]MBU4114753.1 FAD-dependent oxidoreductase [Gammaproteobacteria bacterium]
MKIAIVGSGISGLAVAHTLRGQADLTLFEAGDYFGGHTHTVDLTLDGPQGPVTHGVDTGFLVFNERTYPQFIKLLAELDVATVKSDMSFSVQVPGARSSGPLEWSGSSLSTVFAQRGNLVNPRFLRMLRDVLRFNRLATALAERGQEPELMQPLSDFLHQHNLSDEFRDWYFLPMLGCIWSCPTDQMLRFPVATMIRFCHNHGLIQVTNRPQWWTVAGGARHYVDKIVAQVADKRLRTPVAHITRDAQGVLISSGGQTERFDKVVLASHSDQSLALLGDASWQERKTLGAIRYQPNRAVLHTDTSVLPQQRRAWAAWNYQRASLAQGRQQSAGARQDEARVCLHYLINKLQPLPFAQPVLVSLNPLDDIDPRQVHGSFDYAHPVFDVAAIRAQGQLPALQGQQHTYFCGAWSGYGFHEDGLKSGLDVAARLQALLAKPVAMAPPIRDRLAA